MDSERLEAVGAVSIPSADRRAATQSSLFNSSGSARRRYSSLTSASTLVRVARFVFLAHVASKATWPSAMAIHRCFVKSAIVRPAHLSPLSSRAPAAFRPHAPRFTGMSSIAMRAAASDSYAKMTVRELKGMLTERGLPVGGKKADLIERLEAAEGGSGSDSSKKEATEEKQAEKKDDSDDDDEKEDEGPQPPYGAKLKDPHEGKPEQIMDEDGKIRYLCLDGQYRRGDPDSIECKPENFSVWLTEWVVAARTGQLDGLPQKTFLPEEKSLETNPKGKFPRSGEEMKSEDVLVKAEADGAPVWNYKDPKMAPPAK